jgi:hypothetical protein
MSSTKKSENIIQVEKLEKQIPQLSERSKNMLVLASEWDGKRLIDAFSHIFDVCTQKIRVENRRGKIIGERLADSQGANKALENIAKIIGAYSQPDQNTIVVNNFLTQIQNRYGAVDL